MNRPLKTLLAATTALLLATAPAFAGPDRATQDIFATLLRATVDNDYDKFVSVCDDKMKAALTKPMLEGVSHQIAPLLTNKDKCDVAYLGELQQHGYAVHLWRLHPDTGDDVLATLSVKDGKAGGFLLH